MQWYEAVQIIDQYVFRISTPRGSGTGFLISCPKTSNVCGIATAAHVIDQAHYWEEPLRIFHARTGKSLLVRHDQRAVFLDVDRDTAVILLNRGELDLPNDMLPLAPKDNFLKVGNEIGWLGFPAIPGASLCFFGGKISGFIHDQEAYLVDGVAINGVSGGPAFHLTEALPIIMGVVSAYVPNRATGETLPGLGVVQGVTQFHQLAPTFASLEQAKSQETPPLVSPDSIQTDDNPKEQVVHRRLT